MKTIQINDRWYITVKGTDIIDLWDSQTKMKKRSSYFKEYDKKYNVYVKDTKVIVSSTDRSGIPRLPKYIEKVILEVVKETFGEKDYYLFNNNKGEMKNANE